MTLKFLSIFHKQIFSKRKKYPIDFSIMPATRRQRSKNSSPIPSAPKPVNKVLGTCTVDEVPCVIIPEQDFIKFGK